mgnify:CR=1 FL=1
MVKLIFRETIIFLVCFAIFPGALFLLYLKGELSQTQLLSLARELATTDMVGPWPIFWLLSKILIPYFIVQSIRAYSWSRRSVTGLRYASLFYSALLFSAVVWFWSQSGDLLYFMYQMGDLPSELPQFLELEAVNLLLGALSFYVGLRRFRVFLYALEPIEK